MRGSLLISGFFIFSLGIILSLPAIILSASGSNINTKTEAVTLMVGNVVKDVSNINSYKGMGVLGKIPALLVVIGLALMILSILFRF